MSMTLDYYAKNADAFADSTINVDFRQTQDRFLEKLPEGCRILDFGCGAGRDAKRFLEEGFRVDAVDGSPELCRIASQNTGITVKRMLFQDLDADEEYEGIWACASILHLQKTELAAVLQKMNRALKPNGVIYTSFKEGEFEGERNGRYFTFFTIDSFRKFMSEVFPEPVPGQEEFLSEQEESAPGQEEFSCRPENSHEGGISAIVEKEIDSAVEVPLLIEEYWNTGDVRQGRGEERWLNLILRKYQRNPL